MMLAIADFSDDDGRAYPSVAALARKCRMKPRNANYILSALQESGELRIRLNQGPRGTNLFQIVFAAMQGLQSPAPLQAAARVQHSAGLQSAAGLQSVAPTPAMHCAKPLQPIAAEPSLNRQEPSPSPRKTRAAKSHSEHPLFAEFYTAYPRKVARPDAAKAFAALNPSAADLQAMLKAIESQGLAQRCADGEGRFVPHPATWLNKRRWEDELPSTASPAKFPSAAALHADYVFGGAEP